MGKPGATSAKILDYIEDRGSATGPELAEHLGITRQAVSLQLRKLSDDGAVVKTGSTRAARYFPASAAPGKQRIEREPAIADLDEAAAYDDVAIALNFSRLPNNVESIVHYAFTEMLNNAIDHSGASHCAFDVRVDKARIRFTVRDRGIGAFRSIADKFDLDDEQAAMIELVKGRTTTQPETHSGEGIFFVSKAADRFSLRSHRLRIEWDSMRDDVFVSNTRFLEGTLVDFEIGRHSRTDLAEVFARFAPEEYDYRFERTRVLVKLLRQDYVSRSEAKRLLLNLDKFSEIEIDMRGVRNIGQGFADEIFRVFANANPGCRIRAVNTSTAVDAMIRHVVAP